MAPPGSTNVPLIIGAAAFGITIVSALAAFSARETYRVHLNEFRRGGRAAGRRCGLRDAAGGRVILEAAHGRSSLVVS